jgi:hypothetical protein
MGGCFSQPSTDRAEQPPVSGNRPNATMEVPVTIDDPTLQLGLLKLDGAEDGATDQGREPKLAGTEAHEAGPSEQVDPSPPLQLVLCRFEAEKLLKAVKTPESTKFLAISHVWGKADWRKVGGIEDEIRVSQEKAKFIEEQLPSIVGNEWFWMDVLCINQRDDQARVAITQHIPSVFRFARRTIAVRDSTGFEECCIEAAGSIRGFFSKGRDWRSQSEDDSHIDFGDGPDGRNLLLQHLIEEHEGHVMDEGLLTRLWPLQEIILSNKIQFVRCEPIEGDEQPRIATEYESRKVAVIGSSLASLAITWSTHGEDNDDPYRHRIVFTKNDLVDAFLNLGTASRRYENREVLLPNERDIMLQLNSARVTSKPRDFILAIMPQYGFYKAPQNAKQLTFTELFLDCARQLRGVNSGLSPLFLESDHILDGRVGPLKVEIPEPKCLGDLAKLLDGPVMRCPPGSQVNLEPTRAVLIIEVMDRAAKMLPSPEEMSRLASEGVVIPPDDEESRAHDLKIATNCLVIHTVVRSIFNSTTLWPICYHELNHQLATLPVDAKEKRQAIEALHMILSTIDLSETSYDNAVRITEYAELHALLEATPWEIPIMLAAMISCGLGISGLDWAMDNLSPMQVVVNEVSYLALVPDSVAVHEDTAYYFTEGGEFFAGRDGPMPRLALLAGHPETEGYFTLCMFPPDSKFKGSREY